MAFAGRLGKRGMLVVLGAGILAFAAFSLAGDRGFIRLGRMIDHRSELQARVRSLAEENGRLSEEVRRLRDDPAAIEAIARTRLNMVRPGEVVFVFPSSLEEGSR